MTIFEQTEAPISEESLSTIEELINLKLPVAYRNHLLQYNGGKCIPNVFSFIENDKPSSSIIDWFLAIYDGEYDNLYQYILIYKIDEKRLPSPIIPIAHDPFGNLICISCGQNDYGFIYFWDHEKEVDYTLKDDNDRLNLYLIDTCFEGFISGLKPD